MTEAILTKLHSSKKLERDRGLNELKEHLKSTDEAGISALKETFTGYLKDESSTWEIKHAGLMGSSVLLSLCDCGEDYGTTMQEEALRLLEDEEFRVRLAAGEVMGALCRRFGPVIYANTKQTTLQGIRDNLERQPHGFGSEKEKEEADRLMQKLYNSCTSSSDSDSDDDHGGGGFKLERQNSTDSAQIFHDTAGWKSLETWMKCLQCMLENCGYSFNPYIDQELLDLVFDTLNHTNRFVRETGYYVCGTLVSCGLDDTAPAGTELTNENAIYRHGQQFAEYLGKGLADNWSQVRLAASVATRKFLESIHSEKAREPFYPILIPRMCLNRYYVAEGVRIYNQETWKRVTAGEGKHLVERCIKETVDFYITETEADNHAVREAACACIAELGHKIDKDVVRPHVSRLLDALLVCFADQSWPVRDAACIACGNFVLCFPEESRDSIPALYPLFYENLQDNIPSVRQGAAIALGNVVKAYGAEAAAIVIDKIKEGLQGVEKQTENAERYGGLDKSPATFGVVKKARDNDMDLHTNQTMYSCGSLAPKMGRGKRGGGCMDHQFKRPSEPWELGEGCVHLMAEMSHITQYQKDVCNLLPVLAKAMSHQHYTQHVVFTETVCKQLPRIATGVGKRPFKMYLEYFLDYIFYGLKCENALTSSAASQCLQDLAKLLGPNILRGRVEHLNPRYLEDFDANVMQMPPYPGPPV
ncbi:uncharacterized protein LOC106164872 [Lingula anatina]|uniref:Uncharacterized protein LOC106164872 n=1 Tax=Lingula anatina TaxID=7574 RepID=A0A1S3IJT1_LINAN|nr:uncharacterized protein LOC106164872 [Lingula anatina]|eukprot:XP_013398368.1 uncharacterized protein LOC106164872 [Lingula anatina]